MTHEQMRQKVWLEAWTSTASSLGCKEAYLATDWADQALDEFDARFPAPKPITKPRKKRLIRRKLG